MAEFAKIITAQHSNALHVETKVAAEVVTKTQNPLKIKVHIY